MAPLPPLNTNHLHGITSDNPHPGGELRSRKHHRAGVKSDSHHQVEATTNGRRRRETARDNLPRSGQCLSEGSRPVQRDWLRNCSKHQVWQTFHCPQHFKTKSCKNILSIFNHCSESWAKSASTKQFFFFQFLDKFEQKINESFWGFFNLRLFVLLAVQSLSKQSDLVEAMVKSLAPALVAEMAKMKSLPSSSTSSSSSSSSKAAKASSSTKAKLSLLKCRTSSSSKLKVSVCKIFRKMLYIWF